MNLCGYLHMREELASNTLGNIFSLYSYKEMAINEPILGDLFPRYIPLPILCTKTAQSKHLNSKPKCSICFSKSAII